MARQSRRSQYQKTKTTKKKKSSSNRSSTDNKDYVENTTPLTPTTNSSSSSNDRSSNSSSTSNNRKRQRCCLYNPILHGMMIGIFVAANLSHMNYTTTTTNNIIIINNNNNSDNLSRRKKGGGFFSFLWKKNENYFFAFLDYYYLINYDYYYRFWNADDDDDKFLPFAASRTITTSSNSMSGSGSFASCLLIMDDNHYLIEWLAYHYHVMPLRRLIVMVDPRSRSSPQPVLQRWKDKIEITLWPAIPIPPGIAKNYNRWDQHLWRQRTFLTKCLQHLHTTWRSPPQGDGGGWVMIIDTDEYIMINDRLRSPKDSLALAQPPNIIVPPQSMPGSVIQLLQNTPGAINPHTNETLATIPCLTMGRKIFGTKKYSNNEGSDGFDLSGFHFNFSFNPSTDLQTFMWDMYTNKVRKPGKSIINLNYFPYNQINNRPIHRPGPNEICKGKMFLHENSSVLVVNHYPGTLEQMSFRQDDARGVVVGDDDNNNKNIATTHTTTTTVLVPPQQQQSSSSYYHYRIERFNEYKTMSILVDNNTTIRHWLKGFIQNVNGGQKEAQRLLQYVGKPIEASYLTSTTTTADN